MEYLTHSLLNCSNIFLGSCSSPHIFLDSKYYLTTILNLPIFIFELFDIIIPCSLCTLTFHFRNVIHFFISGDGIKDHK